MDACENPRAPHNRWSTDSLIDSLTDMECQLESLRSLVCDLLKTNQELRMALLEARAGLRYDQEP
jgi:hypothetical protein